MLFRVMAFIGYGVNMLQSIQDMRMIPHLAEQYNQSMVVNNISKHKTEISS